MQVRRMTGTYRNIKRYRQIMFVFFRYGFDDVIDRLGILHFIHLGRRIIPKLNARELETITTAERLRFALEELGPTFIKLGQMLSVRPDLIPERFVVEFQKLQDEVPPFPVEQASAKIEKHLGAPIKQMFTYFDENPLAAASIAQVHRAVLHSGEEVVVKIQRPDIRRIIETDLNIFNNIAGLIEKYIQESEFYSPRLIVEEFAKTIRRELDFIREGRNIDRFRRNFEGDKTVYVPNVFWEFTTDHILTMEYIDGIKASELDKLEKAGYDRKQIAFNGAQAILKQIFEHGFFHADPHPGNIFVLQNNVIAPLDYGMMGSIDNEQKEAIGNMLIGVVKKDIKRILRVFQSLGILDDVSDIKNLKLDVEDFLDRYYEVPLSQLDIGKIIIELTDVIRNNRIKLPADLMLMAKAMVTEEGVGRNLDPDLDFMTLAKPYVRKIMLRRFDPRYQFKEFTFAFDDFNSLLKVFPSEFREIIAKIKNGDLKIKFEHHGLEGFVDELEKLGNRLSLSLIITGLIIGSSLIIQLDKGPYIFGLPVIGMLGYLIAAILGLLLIIATVRKGRF